MVSENDIETLDMYLDGELDDTAQGNLLHRLNTEPELSQQFATLDAHRTLRMQYWRTCEPAEDHTDRWIAALDSKRQRMNWLVSILNYRQQIAAAAACVAVFMIGWNWAANSNAYRMVPGNIQSGGQNVRFVSQQPVQGQQQLIEVRVTDAAGNLVERKLFNTLQEAQQYTEKIRLQLQNPQAH